MLREATELDLREVQGLAYAEAGVLYGLQGLRLESLDAHYRSFQLTDDPVERMRILGDLAVGLIEMGAYDVARIAFEIVARSQARVLVRINAALELMGLEPGAGNRVAFERWRAVVQGQRDSMSPSMTVDYNYKLGAGLAGFGQTKRAQIFFCHGLAAGGTDTSSTPGTSKSRRRFAGLVRPQSSLQQLSPVRLPLMLLNFGR